MPSSFLWSARVSEVFVLRRPLLSLFRLQGLAHAVEDANRLLVVATLDVTLVLVLVVAVVSVTLVLVVVVVVNVILLFVVAVAAVNAILLADDKVLSPHALALTETAAPAVVSLFLS